MDDHFKIYIEQLRDGHVETIEENFAPDFLEIKEKDLSFPNPVSVRGEAYLAEDNLVLHFDIGTIAEVPCAICNEPVKTKIGIKGFYYAVPLEEVKGGIFSFREILRETVLLEAPSLAECHEGNCPQRQSINKYLKKEHPSNDDQGKSEGYHPFANLDLDE